MKRIFHFVSTNVLSGLENVVINICTLVRGYDFTYVSPDGPINKYLDKYHINHISIKRITPLNVRKVIKEYKPDIVQGHDVKASISLAFNSHLCRKNNIKIISELHNDDPRMWKYSLRSILYLFSSHVYDEIIVVSDSAIDNYIFKKQIEYKTTVIKNIINIYRIKSKLHFRHIKRWDCIFLGRLVDQKNPIKFVNIIKEMRERKSNIRAVMVGNGDLRDKIQYHINKLHLSNNISMIGFQNNPFKFLGQSKVLVMPSKYEGLSLVALESLFLGTPIVCSRTSGLLKILNNKCGYFAKSDKDFANKTFKLLTNRDLYKTKSLNSIKQLKHVNDIKQFQYCYATLYSHLS